MIGIPKPGSVNEDGDPIDILENLRAKKELAKVLLPIAWNEAKDLLWRLDGDEKEKVEEWMQKIKDIADSMNLDLEEQL